MMISQARRTANYEIMLDESTRGETKQFIICLIFWDLDKEMPIAQVTHLKNIMRCNGQNPVPRIFSRNKLEKLPYGRRAHEMPDKANEWLNFLIEMKANFYIFFADELHEALNILSEQEFEVLVEQLECGLEKAIESYKKWMTPWYNLPLSICRLGSDLGQSYARVLIHVIFKNSWLESPAEQEIAIQIKYKKIMIKI
ncbi:hypothetical protein C2G38_2309564 [Gigaspora rosea]|uniref:Uncharacterized protein n=1 Tax=Gigaspora rosea TaxID=44941 RepID=A0A397VCQ0_9GLOM|nr:hypothetical protein C2G38_2309564 [Gigaspora rosea]